MDFYEKYNNLTDTQILEILKHHKDYQDAAVEAVVKIGIERQLINSEQDLFSTEFQNIRSNGSTLFPEIPNEFQRLKLIGSIFRFLYVMSFLPLIFGFLKYVEGQLYMTSLGIGIGVIWFLLSFLLYKTGKIVLIIPLFMILIAISCGILWKLISNVPFYYLDLVMLLISTLAPIYLLIFLKRLIQAETGTQ